MRERKILSYRATWTLFLTLAVSLIALFVFGPTSQAGDQPEIAEQVADLHEHSDEIDSGIAFGPGQPLDFYERSFGPADPDLGPRVACFAPGTDERVMAHFVAQFPVEGDHRYNLTGRWSGSQGTPRALTWSFVPDGLSISSGVGEPAAASDLFARMDTLYAAQGGRATWINRFQQCFDRWAQVCGVTYTRITVGGNDWDDGAAWGSAGAAGRGDCRISMKNIDGGSGILAYNFFPSSGDMVIDRSENWGSTTNQNRFLRNTIMHEHGHGLGVLHVCPVNSSKIMEPFLNTGFDGLRHDDIRAGQRHYGDIYESNNTAATANNIGTLIVGTPINLGALPLPPSGTNPANSSTMSIDANVKNDFYRFHVDTPVMATVTVTPQGLTYLSGPQNGDGSCSPGTNVNSLAMADLVVEIRDTNGVTVLGTANATGAGSAETLAGVSLPAAGDYYVQVFENNTPTETQLYTLALSAASCPSITVSPLTLTDATVGVPYNQVLSAAGGTGPYTFSVTSGALPAGLTLSSGTISGTPTGPTGGSNFTITATDSATNCIGAQSYTLFVACPTVSLAPASLPSVTVGNAYNQTITGSGANGSYTFAVTAGGTPPGITLSPAGNLTGTPTVIGTFNFTVTATDTSGCLGSQAYSISVMRRRVAEPI